MDREVVVKKQFMILSVVLATIAVPLVFTLVQGCASIPDTPDEGEYYNEDLDGTNS